MNVKITLWVVIIFFMSTSFLPAQDSTSVESSGKLKNRIESIVKDIFKQVEKELGTTIYEDDEEELEDDYIAEDENNDEEIEDKTDKLSLYAFPVDKGIVRNYSTKFISQNIEDKFLFRYNRVEGLFLGFQSPQKFYWDENRKFTLFGSLGYGFGEHRWRFNVGAAQQFGFGNHLFEFGIEGHSFADTRDNWLVGNLENTLSALVSRYDYRDHYGRNGYTGWLGLYVKKPTTDMQFKLSYLNDDYDSLSAKVNWSLFRTKKSFRENPAIIPGEIRSLLFTFDLHNLSKSEYMPCGWSLSLSAEFAGKTLKGGYDFNRYVIDLRRYQPISQYDNINLRLRAATSEGNLPLQRMYELGGISTLPAFGYKQFAGNRLLLANIEYIVNGKMFAEGTDFPLSLLDNVNLILFTDAGFVDQVQDNLSLDSGFDNFTFKNIKSDVGFGFGTRDGKYRLGFAWRTDIKSPVSVFFRMNRPF
ncbi:MAG: BamA/TamA family outer membrane protein [Bacteroidota bacterium]